MKKTIAILVGIAACIALTAIITIHMTEDKNSLVKEEFVGTYELVDNERTYITITLRDDNEQGNMFFIVDAMSDGDDDITGDVTKTDDNYVELEDSDGVNGIVFFTNQKYYLQWDDDKVTELTRVSDVPTFIR